MIYNKGLQSLNLPDSYQFGVELEAFNVHTKKPKKDMPSLYMSKDSNEFIEKHRWKKATALEESLVSFGGAELVSPILHDTKEDWQNLLEICEHMKKYPGKYANEVITDSRCGCHVHFDARVLTGRNIQETESMMGNFLRLWAEAEELIYKMCNDVGQPIRDGSLENKLKGIERVASKLQGVKGMASPTGKKILKAIEEGNLRVSYKKFGILKRIVALGKLDPRRYHGLNLTNIGNPRKNTIEFRISNGTLDFDTIKKNIYLYASILQLARNMTLEPQKISSQLNEFFKTNVSEEQKVDSFLNLLFREDSDKQIYKERWNSVKDAPVFIRNEKQFAEKRFKRDEFRQITFRTPVTLINEAFLQLKQMVQSKNIQSKNKSIDEEEYVR